MTGTRAMSGDALLGRSPGATMRERVQLAGLRAVRTLIQGVVAAFPAAGAGTLFLTATYWETFLFAFFGAAVTALASFLQNVAAFLPEDPTQKREALQG